MAECKFRVRTVCGYEFCNLLTNERCPENEPRSDCPYDDMLEGVKRGLEDYRAGNMRLWSEVKEELGLK